MPENPEPRLEHDRDLPATRYFASLYSSATHRRLLNALFGIENELAASLRVGLDHQVSHARLQWWREECARALSGHPVHPLTRELVAASEPATLDGLTGLVDAAAWDLAGATFETRPELTAYCERWAAAVIAPLAQHRVAGKSGGVTPDSDLRSDRPLRVDLHPHGWRSLGASLRELELLSDLAREAHSGRLRIPLDELERANVATAALAKPPWPSALVELLRQRHETLRTDIAHGLKRLSGDDRLDMRGVLVWLALAIRASRRIERDLPNTHTPRRLDAIGDAWLAWRTARAATAGRHRLD